MEVGGEPSDEPRMVRPRGGFRPKAEGVPLVELRGEGVARSHDRRDRVEEGRASGGVEAASLRAALQAELERRWYAESVSAAKGEEGEGEVGVVEGESGLGGGEGSEASAV